MSPACLVVRPSVCLSVCHSVCMLLHYLRPFTLASSRRAGESHNQYWTDYCALIFSLASLWMMVVVPVMSGTDAGSGASIEQSV